MINDHLLLQNLQSTIKNEIHKPNDQWQIFFHFSNKYRIKDSYNARLTGIYANISGMEEI